ncbi:MULTISPECIES: anthranilate synthase component II [Staphylococcus]|uniref:Aminodeoxychorismate/anthranilate synthase component II n=1 Tax=Staphylococcus hsinchuensis TaxID=3051183 RepID=A0ABZ3EFB0_9STAP|nr:MULTISPECIES: aminodeoxychorismate/anthranilate synthase component II [unclassified Staphylococcus]
MILMIDNKDSFTYNIVDYIKRSTDKELRVIDVDEVNSDLISNLSPEALIISPGPGTPSEYSNMLHIYETIPERMPILGVCLGFQQLVYFFKGDIIHNKKPVHGHTTCIHHNNEGIFKGLPQGFKVMRYHSLMADSETFPRELKITAKNEEGIIMAFEHQSRPIYGVQYHPESILSDYGIEQFQLFIEQVEGVLCE